jgi:hypothetical protein
VSDRQTYRQTDICSPRPTTGMIPAVERRGDEVHLLRRWLRWLIPRDPVDARMLACVAVVRLLLMPLFTLALVGALRAAGVLPADPVCTLVLLMQVNGPSFLTWSFVASLEALSCLPCEARLACRYCQGRRAGLHACHCHRWCGWQVSCGPAGRGGMT